MMNEMYSSAMAARAAGRLARYRARIGTPSTAETITLLRFASHQCGTQSGHTAIARSMATNGITV
jgi:hypothetical protein